MNSSNQSYRWTPDVGARVRQKMLSAQENEPIVFTNGCFDLLHPGHLHLLKFARRIAGRGILVVGLNSDWSIRRLKGDSRPIFLEEDRLEMVRSIKGVDEVFIFDEDTPYELIRHLNPDIVVKGGDYRPSEVVGNDVADVFICPLFEGWSTSDIIERIKNG